MTNKKTFALISSILLSFAASNAQAAPAVDITATATEARTAGSCPKPAYPLDAARAEQSGVVDLSYRILASGDIVDVATHKGWDLPHIRRDALIALKRCKLSKADKDSERQVVRYVYTLN